jgi:hypothetical protein
MKLAFCWLQVVGVTVVAAGFDDDEEEPEEEEVDEVPDEVGEVPGKVEGESVEEDDVDVGVDEEVVVEEPVVVHGLGSVGKSVIPCCWTTASISGRTAPS